MAFVRLRVAHTIESGLIIRFNLAKFSSRVRVSLPPSLAYAYSYTSIPFSGISRVSVASYHRKQIWPRGWGISELKRIIRYLTAFHSQTQAQLSISRIRCWCRFQGFQIRDNFCEQFQGTTLETCVEVRACVRGHERGTCNSQLLDFSIGS